MEYAFNTLRRSLGCLFLGLSVAYWNNVFAVEDNQFVTDKRITVDQYVAAVLTHNPDLPAAQATWEAAKARIAQARSLDDPMLSYHVAPQSTGTEGMDFGQKLSVSQRVPWLGKRKLRGEVARLESDAAFEKIEKARLKLIKTAKEAFTEWYFVHAAININSINKSLLEEFRNIAEIKYSAGRASKQDTLRAEVEYTLLEHRDIVLERRRRDMLAVLNTLKQNPPDQPLPAPSDLPEPIPLIKVERLRALALQIHPDLRALAVRIKASQSRVALAKHDFYPDFQLTTGYNTLWNQAEKRFTLGVSINIPLFSKRHAVKDEALANTMRLDMEYRSKVAQLIDEVQRAYNRVRESTHVNTLYQERLLPLAEENLAAALSDYEAGSGSFLDLISAEKNLMQTRLHLEQSLADFHQHLATLEYTVAGKNILQPIHSESENHDEQ